MSIRVRGLTADLGGRRVVSDVDVEVAPGEVHGLVGPNGSGKTTVLRALHRAIEPGTGEVEVAGVARHAPRRRLARVLAATTQEQRHDAALTVREVVEQGRTPHLGLLDRMRAEDRAAVAEALRTAELDALADRDVRTLSGGEGQRVALARSLAQRPVALLLDEPTNHLDLRHQYGVLALLRKLAADGLAVLLTLHDLRHAVEFCDRLTVLHEGRVRASGPPTDVLDEQLLAEVFGVRATIRPGPELKIDGVV
ncbi:ABC transporter ATP-binding protein [Saccharopolyspora cebuensis]|uniref:ABC transporter ATP-binding protein n=1 Tax=Saccharopolyspora cebuensis TaxID=418759 RepID=A0ABV4CH74_9PSEU